MPDKKWTPIKISNEEEKEALRIIKDCIRFTNGEGQLDEVENALIEKFLQHYEDLSYFQTINTYLWATDQPEKVNDPENLLFQITFYEDEE